MEKKNLKNEEKKLAKKAKLDEKRLKKEEKKLAIKNKKTEKETKNKLRKKEKSNVTKNIVSTPLSTSFQNIEFEQIKERIIKKNLIRSYPDINDIPN